MFLRISFLIVFIFLILSIPILSQWIYLQGPYCGEVRVIINDNDILYTGTSAGGIYKSIDSGSNWINIGLNGNVVRSIAAEENYIAAGTDKGLFISSDNGSNWQIINSISTPVRSLYKEQTIIIAGTDNGIFRSTDNGLTWTQSGLTASSIRALHKDMNGIIYAGTSGQGLFRSSNNGITWTSSGLTSGYVRSVRSYASSLYVSMWGGVKISNNNGTTFSSIGLDAHDVSEIAVFANLIYASTWEGVFKSTNTGGNWTLLNFSESITWSLMAVNNNIIFVGRDGEGIYKTTNGGINWEAANNGLNAARVWSVHQHNQQTFFAGTSGGAYKSTDGGVNWELTASSIYANRFWSSLTLFNDDILLGTSRGILRSTDTGSTWNLITSNQYSVKQIVQHSNGFILAGTTSGVLRSTDNGITWTVQNGGLLNTSVSDLMITPNGQVYVSTTGGSGVYRSTNNGGSWASVNIGVSSISSITFDYLGHLYAVSSTLILKSTNNGTNWFTISSGLPGETPYYSSIEVDDSGYVYAGSFNGFYIGYEFGNMWLLTPTYFSNPNVLSVMIADDGRVFAGLAGSGIVEMESPYIPVELTSFSAYISGNNVTLNWKTITEINNKGFEIERKIYPLISENESDDLQEHNSFWHSIGFVDGSGTSTEPKHYLYIDKNVSNGKNIYRLKQIDFDGSFSYSNVTEVEISITEKFILLQNFPNPFNPSTVISYQLPEKSIVTLKIYDLLGKEAAVLINNEWKEAGIHYYTLNSSDYSFTSGVYIYNLRASEFSSTKKFVLLK